MFLGWSLKHQLLKRLAPTP